MRKSIQLYLIIILSATGLVSNAETVDKEKSVKKKDLVGVWEGKDSTGKVGAFQFYQDGKVVISIGGKNILGPDVGKDKWLIFTADYSKDPAYLDIYSNDSSPDTENKLLMIVKFITDDRILLRTFFNNRRPLGFKEGETEDTIELYRVR